MKKKRTESLGLKKKYSPPKVEISFIEMEQGIAAGSATVIAPNSNNQVTDEWVVDPDNNTPIDWQ
ncbi:hypothetical protein [Elizabethkingia anophelis]|uniref:hypothetical protein n=1 Tax=Elizabethkingia anophelis TaxID=1117645 RepID=UPI003F1A9E57